VAVVSVREYSPDADAARSAQSNARRSATMVIRSHEKDVSIDETPFHRQILDRAKSYGPSVTALVTNRFLHYDSLIELFQTDADSSKTVSYKELFDKSYALATYIGNLGAAKGDVACICLPNCIEYPIIFLGVAIIGGITSGSNPEYTAGKKTV
jgi:acyl-CoA synthetase (AMP-forming)/AMP-acid ligase II